MQSIATISYMWRALIAPTSVVSFTDLQRVRDDDTRRKSRRPPPKQLQLAGVGLRFGDTKPDLLVRPEQSTTTIVSIIRSSTAQVLITICMRIMSRQELLIRLSSKQSCLPLSGAGTASW
jgi:hypothetical protein